MKILEHTSRRLVILYHPVYSHITDTIFIVIWLGGGLYYYAMTQNLALLIFPCGIAICRLLELRDVHFTFDKTLNSLVVKQRRLTGERFFKYLLQDILAVEVFRLNRKAVLYGVKLRIRPNEEVEINHSGTFSELEAQNLAKQISQFLGIN
jgi:hypothetical protein